MPPIWRSCSLPGWESRTVSVIGMDMPADFALKATLPPTSGKGAAMLISVIPGYQSGQRLASLKSAMVSCGEALIWTVRCTIAIVDLFALSFVVPLRDAAGPIGCGRTGQDHRRAPGLSTDRPFLREQQRDGPVRAADIGPDRPSRHDGCLGGQAGAPALRGTQGRLLSQLVRSSALSPVSLLLRTRTTSAQDLAPAIARRRAWACSAL